ncbi:MAG: hypothetical protein JKY56_12795 [Kofleriaceae bacterium]|nr:hypothetical protein [Kofleriaceae bacterium]
MKNKSANSPKVQMCPNGCVHIRVGPAMLTLDLEDLNEIFLQSKEVLRSVGFPPFSSEHPTMN